MKSLLCLSLLAVALALAPAAAASGNCSNTAHLPFCSDTQTISTSGHSITIQSNGGLVPSFEVIPAGSPATISVVTSGCSAGGTCETLDTYTTVASAIRSPTVAKPYSYYTVAATWSGGGAVSVQVNTNLTTARNGGGSSFNPAAPGPIGMTTPNTILATCPASGLTTGEYCPPAGSVLPANVIYAQYIAGVDCTGATDSSAALNTWAATGVSGKAITFRGCPLVRVTSTWLLHGIHALEIDLGNTINQDGSYGSLANSIIGGCGGSTGQPVINVDASAYLLIHGGGIVTQLPGCTSSAFTMGVEYTPYVSSGFTSTNNLIRDTYISPSTSGANSTANFRGIAINGNPNQEEFQFQHVHITCNNVAGSYGLWLNDQNADSTVFEKGSINNCWHGVQNDAGVIRIRDSDLGQNGSCSVFGACGAAIVGPAEEVTNTFAEENSGTFMIPNAGGNCGGRFESNNLQIWPDMDSAKSLIACGWNHTVTLENNSFEQYGGTPAGNLIVSVDGYAADLGGNKVPGGLTLLPISDTINGHYTTALTNQNSQGSAGTNQNWQLWGGAWPTAGNAGSIGSGILSFAAPWWNTSVSNDAFEMRSAHMGGVAGGSTTATLALTYEQAFGGITPLLSIQPALTGVSTSKISQASMDTAYAPAVQNIGTAGLASYSYVLQALGGCGHSAPTSAISTSTGNAALNGTNFNRLSIYNTPGAWGIAVYRTAGGATQGLIGTATVTDALNLGGDNFLRFDDTGLAGDGTTAPTGDTSGCVKAAGPISGPTLTLTDSSCTSGTYAKGDGSGCGSETTLPSQYTTWMCEPGLGDGYNPMPAQTYLQSTCYNMSGATWTITSIKCYVDGGTSSTLALTDGSSNNLINASTFTCGTTGGSSTQSATTTIGSGGYIKFSFAADGTAKQTTWVVSGTY